MNQQKQSVINNLRVTTDNTDLNALGAEVTALKVALGLMFQKLQEPLREIFLKELRQTNTPALNDLADQLEQFRV
ncbi:hypothetical protein RSG63_004180 [Yersinia enterocolitica]|uniref:hypothetical protein n=1 Tax=Yersinia TaxID=629 RepID=UPI00119D6CF0|nr:hypothetical protein [Yersinia alsatica]EKN3779783.1 hypothetical protein [Yersinia enterocolitica]EKN4854356.1 hypothetical protein [Yersinia enterocolitica]EKN6263114.1 hypothetical protein [Yersinia enterocolitica]ELI8374804.1 hypothetical protein [Yersinia enterocolitica]ELW8194985.1 hypothetical protein [Yersinia enterocolitica]